MKGVVVARSPFLLTYINIILTNINVTLYKYHRLSIVYVYTSYYFYQTNQTTIYMNKIPYSIRIEPDLLEKIKLRAKIETRSSNNMIEFAIKYYLEAEIVESKIKNSAK